jgi:hypothetical protein
MWSCASINAPSPITRGAWRKVPSRYGTGNKSLFASFSSEKEEFFVLF